MVNLFYNYYKDSSDERSAEIDFCFFSLCENKNIDNIFVMVGGDDLEHMNRKFKKYSNKMYVLVSDDRPIFSSVIYDLLNCVSRPESINILINSDCFFGDDTDWDFINSMSVDDSFCVCRYELKSINPVCIDFDKEFPRQDSQDCWIFRGFPKSGMDCGFKFGVPGCDNRLAHEFGKVGYKVSGPVSKIKVLHYHTTNKRNYNVDCDRLPGQHNGLYKVVELS